LRVAAGDEAGLSTTIFNAWMVLRPLVEPPKEHHPPNLEAEADAPSHWIGKPTSITPTWSPPPCGTGRTRAIRRAVRSRGADGIFLSVGTTG
jgi:hypothetical protein